jgi:hypothetical protein
MGEFSKRVGEVGEAVVYDFLKMIGWIDPMRNDDIATVDTEFRKKTNGIDGYYHYISPMVTGTVENVIYSCKYSTAAYPNSALVKTFKEYYLELAKAIESFKKSTLKQNTMSMHDNIETSFDRGVIFYLNNSGDPDKDIISKLSKIELTTETNHDGIFLVDNKRIEFMYDSINYAKLIFPDHERDFIYFNNGLNNDERNLRNGRIMPIQYINSSIIPLRASKNNETTVIILSIDKFDKDDLMKLMGIAKNIGCNVQGATFICFPDYSETAHAPIVNQVKQIFREPSFTEKLTVANYNNPILR